MPTVKVLRAELKKRGLDTKGKKAELEARLAEAESGAAADDGAAAAAAAKEAAAAAEAAAAKEAAATKQEEEAKQAKQQEEEAKAKAAAEAAKAAEAREAAAARQAEGERAAREQAEREKAAAAAAAAASAATAAQAEAPAAAAAPGAAAAPPPAAPAAAAPVAAPVASGFGSFGDSSAPAAASAGDGDDKAARAEARREKLRELRLKMNTARKANHDGVRDETRAAHSGGNEHKRKHADYVRKKKDAEKAALEAGEDISKPEMYETAEVAEAKAKKQKKKDKNKASFGWEVFNQDNLFKAYKKRTAAAGDVDKEDYSALKHSYAASGGNFYPSANEIAYGHQSTGGAVSESIPEANIQRMVNELDDAAAKRKNFSRRRAHNDDRDVDSINERNAVFNRKVGRAFDKYTVEIRQNLERGTALPN